MAAICVVRFYQMQILFERIYMHLHYLKPLKVHVPWTAPLSRFSFWLEICIIVPHCPPFFTTSFGVESMQNFSAYRIETLLSVYNILRAYTLWRCFVGVCGPALPFGHTSARLRFMARCCCDDL